ncbi:MAG TPA: PspA/IM30 family protein, partial [Acidimicrobiales bacterium]|nr:PspA/IM30 family protein [Acidimicrobiales bacterium]
QHQQIVEEERKLGETLKALQARVNQFRTQKETMKAQYSAATAVSSVNESVAGISKSFGDSGQTLQRAQDKIASLQARSGALDELLESGVLEDVGGGTDDIQKELDQIASSSSVDSELAALKAEVGGPVGSLGSGDMAPAGALGAGGTEDAEVTSEDGGAGADESGAGGASGAATGESGAANK